MKLLWERLRRIAPGAAGYGACMGLCLFWLVQYARLSGLYSLLSALRAAVPSLPFVLIDLLYLFILLRCALLGVHSLDFSAPGDADRIGALPLSREQLALARLGAHVCALMLAAVCGLGVLAAGGALSAGWNFARLLIVQTALRLPALLCAFLAGFMFSGIFLRRERALTATVLLFALLHGAALLALSGVLPAWARYLSPVYTFDSAVHPLPALAHAAASLLCVPPALWRFGRRDLA